MIELLHIDCMVYMATVPDKYFDLAIVDPPYGIKMSKGTFTYSEKKGISSKRNYVAKQWDDNRPPAEYFKELQRISENQIICGGNYFADLLPASRGWVYWDKKITNDNNTNFSDGELMWTSFYCILKKVTYDWIGFGYLNSTERGSRIHPTQKPVFLYKWLLKNYAKPEYKIFDSHLGSASSAIAAYDFGCDFVGTEIDLEYYTAACVRFENHKKQLTLFPLDKKSSKHHQPLYDKDDTNIEDYSNDLLF